MPTPQLPLRHLKPLALRLAFLDAFPVDPEPDADCSSPPDALASVIRAIDGRLASHPRTSHAVDVLDEAVKQIAAETHTEFASHALAYPRGLGEPFNEFNAIIGRLSCADCTQVALQRSSEARTCNGHDETSDAIAVEHGGHCIRQIKSIYETALDVARAYYNRFVPNAPTYTVSFATHWLDDGDHIDNFPQDVHAWGTADLYAQSSVVALNVKPARFDRKTYQSLFYVLLHECMCHVFQGSVDVMGGLFVVGNGDVFGEGWMDWVTHLVFARVIALNGTFGSRWAALLPKDADCETRGGEIHNYRTDAQRGGISERLHRGVTAARNLQGAFNEALSGRAAEERMIQLSLQINVLPLNGSEREELVTNVRGIFGRRRSSERRAAVALISDYLRDGSVNLFVERSLRWFDAL